jgi:CubicO group peptidase (beta-lactamase class C family)
MLRCLCLLLALSVPPVSPQTLPSVPPESVGISAGRLSRLNAVLEKYVQESRIAGAVTYVARYGKVVHHQAYGMRDIENKRPMTADTFFRIASQTKAVTSVAVMILVEEGAVRLADPVSKFLPAFQQTMVIVPPPAGSPAGSRYGTVPARRAITIRDLLTHTAGIGYGANAAEKQYRDANLHMWYFAVRRTTRREVCLWLQHRHSGPRC